jgi:hypothetical protein
MPDLVFVQTCVNDVRVIGEPKLRDQNSLSLMDLGDVKWKETESERYPRPYQFCHSHTSKLKKVLPKESSQFL